MHVIFFDFFGFLVEEKVEGLSPVHVGEAVEFLFVSSAFGEYY